MFRKFRSYFLQASRLLIPPASTSRRIPVHFSMSVITHFPRDSEHRVTCIDHSTNASLAQNQRARVMSAALSRRRFRPDARCTFTPAFTHIDRINRNGHYSPDNCQFLSPEEHYKKSGREKRKLTDEQEADVRRKRAMGYKQKDLAMEFRVSSTLISLLLNGHTYCQ